MKVIHFILKLFSDQLDSDFEYELKSTYLKDTPSTALSDIANN